MNTGWTGRAYGAGKRINLAHTRAIIDTIHGGKVAGVRTQPDSIFGLHVVAECPGVPSEILMPRNVWDDKAAYDSTAQKVFELFQDNFRKFTSSETATMVQADTAA